MAIQPMALGVANPEINALSSLAAGQQARQSFDMNNIQIAKAGLETIGSIALGSMGGKIDGQADPALFNQGLDYLAQQGVNVDQFRDRADLAPVIARSSLTALQQMQMAQDEKSYQLALDNFELEVMKAAQGPAAPSGYQWANGGGALQAIPGGPADKPADREIRTGPDGVDRYVDTGEPVFPNVAPAPPEPGGAQFDVEGKLRTEYQGGQGYKDFVQQEQAYQRVLDSAKDASPAGDLALIFNYMKVLDPGSVVRESEFATAASSGAFGERVQAAVNQVINGQRLSPEMRRDFVQRAGDLFSGASNLFGAMNERYSTLSGEYGVDPARVVRPGAQIGIMSPDFSLDQWLGGAPVVDNLPPAPEGMDPEVWQYLTPEERALWN